MEGAAAHPRGEGKIHRRKESSESGIPSSVLLCLNEINEYFIELGVASGMVAGQESSINEMTLTLLQIDRRTEVTVELPLHVKVLV